MVLWQRGGGRDWHRVGRLQDIRYDTARTPVKFFQLLDRYVGRRSMRVVKALVIVSVVTMLLSADAWAQGRSRGGGRGGFGGGDRRRY